MSSRLTSTLALLPAIGVMWALYLIDLLVPGLNLLQFGIMPRTLEGSLGIITSPFLHANIFHLTSNTIPLLILPALVIFSEGRRKMWLILLMGILLSGSITWLFGTGGTIVGASGVIFVLIGYLIFDCIFYPCARSISTGLITIILFGSSIFSLYHFAPNISLAAHAGGLIAGGVLAKLYGAPKSTDTVD